MRPLVEAAARAASLALAGAILLTGTMAGLDTLDRAFPPPLDPPPLSREAFDRDGRLLRALATPDGRWRLPVELDEVDPAYLAMLTAYEDGRFANHAGVDPRAVLRAAGQFILNGRIVSGASTITMQLARLLEPRRERSLAAKLRQMARAIQIERRLTKPRILERYLTLAPYGGNLEGLRAASLAWFGKEPKRLTVAQAALLVALPQSPEARRPDRFPEAAKAARRRVLERTAAAGVIQPDEIARAGRQPIPTRRLDLPQLAVHATDEAFAAAPAERAVELTISRPAQEGLEQVAREAARRLGPKPSLAMVMSDASSGEIVALVGSPDPFDSARDGWIDMSRAVRSPGSTLKPFIYGLAFEEGLVAQETVIEDRPADFAGYRPRNFDLAYQGDVSVRQALQLSLNVPAVKLLDEVGPARLAARMRRAGSGLDLPRGEPAGLAIGLGGAGLSLRALVQAYGAFANRGAVLPLVSTGGADRRPTNLLAPRAAWQVADILSGVVPPEGAPHLGIAYKTGTSYGYRDAWSVGFDGRHVLGVWAGRPDGGWVPGLTGYGTAAPILFEAFARSGIARTARSPAPAGAVRLEASELPVTQRRFVRDRRMGGFRAPEDMPRFVYPPHGAEIELGRGDGEVAAPLILKLEGGRPPFRWLANGRPIDLPPRRRQASWSPDGAGFSTLTVIDAVGRAARVGVLIR
ncbi:MAG: penicillin-binding protein 1C [Rhizobiaceae bacterium]|nr:penicillin-binding protein 1C [Rhizobiaceae bacterium]MCV0407826.1 penicillin-binding protein 1C [Rhizobiaceae bacterium]